MSLVVLVHVAPTEGERALAFDRFADADGVDFNLLISGPASVDGAELLQHSLLIL